MWAAIAAVAGWKAYEIEGGGRWSVVAGIWCLSVLSRVWGVLGEAIGVAGGGAVRYSIS